MAIEIGENVIETAAGPTFVKTMGQGPVVFVVHGGPGFDHQYLQPGFASLAQKRTLVFYDQPGCGATPAPADGASLAGTARHFRGLVETVAAGGAFGLIAHSWGALVALAAGAETGTSPLPPYSEGLLINPVPVTRQQYEVCRTNLLSRVPVETQKAAEELMMAGAEGSQVMDILLPYYHSRPTEVPKGSFPFRYDTYLAVNETLGDFDFQNQLAAVAPLALVVGSDDFTTPDLVRGIANAVSEVHTLPSVGHFPFTESEVEFQAILSGVIS